MQQYEEQELVGKGSYGLVYKVRSKKDDCFYVLKKIAYDGAPAADAEASLREARVLSLLRHPHVVPYKEMFKHTDGNLCLIMAYCEGGDLFQYVRQLRKAGQHVSEAQAWKWLVQLLLSLQYIHAKKILHRDVKTQNVFLSQGKVMLGDFGLAKQLESTCAMAHTPIGTPYFMAPEIYEEQPYSYKSDVWALGCVMYETLTGKPAFAAENLSRVVLRVIRGLYDPLPDSYSQGLRDVIACMLCKSVKRRPSCDELLTHPAVVPHVKAYLDALSAESPEGWSTWRMKLPLSVMAQMANVLETARRISVNGLPPTMPAAAKPPRPLTASSATRLPQKVENLMATDELITDFSLHSLLLHDAGDAVGGREGIVHPVKANPLDKMKLPPIGTPTDAAADIWAGKPYAELKLLQHQINKIPPAAPGVHAAALTADDGDSGLANELKEILDRDLADEPDVRGGNKAKVVKASSKEKGPQDVNWLSGQLPRGGFAKGVTPS